jgi:predicted permease
MTSVLVTVIPVFALIGLGYLAARMKLFPGESARGLSQFVFLFAIPALLFRTAASVDIGAAAPWGLWGAYFAAAALVWVVAVLLSRAMPALSPAGGASAAIASTFGNLVMLGLPLSLSYFGEASLLPAALLISIHAPVHWFAATVLAQWSGRGAGQPLSALLREFLLSLVRNPIIVALVGGALWGLTGLALHPVVDRPVELLAQAGVPTALFALGLSLAAHGLKGHLGAVSVVIALKMALFPALAWVAAVHVFALPPAQAGVVALFAALPTGANAYIFAEQHRAAVPVVSGAIALGTALGVLTISALLWLLGPA